MLKPLYATLLYKYYHVLQDFPSQSYLRLINTTSKHTATSETFQLGRKHSQTLLRLVKSNKTT